MRRWGLATCGGAVPWRPLLAGRACGNFPPSPPLPNPVPSGTPPAGEAVLWRPPPAGRVCGSFPPPHHLRWGGSLATPAGWEGMRKHSSSHSPAHRVKVSSESVPQSGTPKLFAIHSSLFSFSARSQARAKNKGIPTRFSGGPREPLPRKGDFIASVRGLRASRVWAFLA